jgi:hypothetical protein
MAGSLLRTEADEAKDGEDFSICLTDGQTFSGVTKVTIHQRLQSMTTLSRRLFL